MGVFSFQILGVPEKRYLMASGIRNQTKERLNKLWEGQEDIGSSIAEILGHHVQTIPL